VLEQFYVAVGGEKWKSKISWISTVPLSEWQGVAVNATGSVTTLQVRNNDLSGYIRIYFLLILEFTCCYYNLKGISQLSYLS
jgi:hypothetical protein